MKERIQNKKEVAIDNMSNEEVVNELKEKKLPTYGTAQERKDRLKKHYGKLVKWIINFFRIDSNHLSWKWFNFERRY